MTAPTDGPPGRRRRRRRRSLLDRRRSLHLISAYRETSPTSRRREGLGLLVMTRSRSTVYLARSLSVRSWGPLGATVHVRRRHSWSSEMALVGEHGRFRAVFRLPLTPERRARRALDRWVARAQGDVDNDQRVRDGEWWLDRSPFAQAGLAGVISISDVVYGGGWNGRVRRYRSGRRRILDLGPEGLYLRGFSRNLSIPWADIVAIRVDDRDEGGVALSIATRNSGTARFLALTSERSDLDRVLGPVVEAIGRTGPVEGSHEAPEPPAEEPEPPATADSPAADPLVRTPEG